MWGHFRRTLGVSNQKMLLLLLNVLTGSFLTPRRHKPDASQERGAHNWSSVKTAAKLDAGQDFRPFYTSLLLLSISTDTEERRGGQSRCSSLKAQQEDVTRSPQRLWAALSGLECSKERRPERRMQAIGNWTVFICYWLLCWWFTLLKLLWLFEYVRSDASRSINRGHDEFPLGWNLYFLPPLLHGWIHFPKCCLCCVNKASCPCLN